MKRAFIDAQRHLKCSRFKILYNLALFNLNLGFKEKTQIQILHWVWLAWKICIYLFQSKIWSALFTFCWQYFSMSTFFLLLHFLEKLDLRNMLHCSYFQSVLMPQVPSKQIAFACFEKFYLKSFIWKVLFEKFVRYSSQ